MAKVLIATDCGCRIFSETGGETCELSGRKVGPLAAEADGACFAIVDDHLVWRRSADGTWSEVGVVGSQIQSIVSCGGTLFCGGMNDAEIIRLSPDGGSERLKSFDAVPGRGEWFAGGPPLGVRSLAKTSDERVVIAAVHVGGMPRSEDGGETWTPTIPVRFDVHQVSGHLQLPHMVVAAAAVGLCVSGDAGRTWNVISEGPEVTDSLAVAVLADEALFSVQDGPFAKRSQVWRWVLGGKTTEAVRAGLPEWLEGKIDTGQIAAGAGRAAVVDGGGTLWLSDSGSRGWRRLATGLPYAIGTAVL